MATNFNIARSPRKSPAWKEITQTHIHFCPGCKKEYAGYAAKCQDPEEQLCGICLAEEFRK